MKHNGHNGDWLDNLEAIIAGDVPASEENEELLHIATRLASALAPLREIARTNAGDTSNGRDKPPPLPCYEGASPCLRANRGEGNVHSSGSGLSLPGSHRKKLKHPSRAGLLVAVLLLLVCSIISTSAVATFWNGAKQALQASTSLDQINGVSIASLARPHAGLKPLPLLPTTLPSNTQASTYGVLTDASDPNVMTTFVADYRINGQDMQLYEQPSDIAFLSTTAQTVQIGAREGQLFQDDKGNHALQWYQSNMLCQLTSKLPATLLIEIASVFQQIKSWDLIR